MSAGEGDECLIGAAHASNALATAGLVFAAGIFTGVLSGTKMVDAMANTVTGIIPDALGPYMAPITALVSIPFTVLISNDAFYFGMLPVLAQSAEHYGITAMEIARASLVGEGLSDNEAAYLDRAARTQHEAAVRGRELGQDREALLVGEQAQEVLGQRVAGRGEALQLLAFLRVRDARVGGFDET